MFSEIQKIVKKKIRTRVLLCGAALIILLAVFGSSFLKIIQGPADLHSLSLDELPGAYVEADVNVLIDTFAEYTETSKYGNESTTKLYYIIPVGEAEYMGLGVKPKDFDKASQISDETYEYIMGERDELTSSMHIKGTITGMDGRLNSYYYDWFKETGFVEYVSEGELEQYALAYVIEPSDIGVFDGSIVYLVLAICLGLLLGIIIYIVRESTGAYLSQIKRFIANNESTDSLEAIEADYQNAANIEAVRVGKNYTFYFKGINAIIVKNSDIIWAYLKRTTHRTNGLKTHVTKELMLCTSDRTVINIAMRKEEGVTAALKQYSINNPNIILGFSDELEKCFKKDINGFINLSRQQEAAYANAAAAGAATSGAATSDASAEDAATSNAYTSNASAEYAAGVDDRQGAKARVVIVNGGENKILVIKAIREILECGLKEAKDLVDNLPSVMLDNIPLNDALAIKQELESHGATVEIENVV